MCTVCNFAASSGEVPPFVISIVPLEAHHFVAVLIQPSEFETVTIPAWADSLTRGFRPHLGLRKSVFRRRRPDGGRFDFIPSQVGDDFGADCSDAHAGDEPQV